MRMVLQIECRRRFSAVQSLDKTSTATHRCWTFRTRSKSSGTCNKNQIIITAHWAVDWWQKSVSGFAKPTNERWSGCDYQSWTHQGLSHARNTNCGAEFAFNRCALFNYPMMIMRSLPTDEQTKAQKVDIGQVTRTQNRKGKN